MTAILVLLALLSVATLAARRGYAAFLAHIVTTPLLLGAGLVVSPQALGFLTTSTTQDLVPALNVGAAWLALLLGLRGIRPQSEGHYARLALGTLIILALTWAALGGLTYVALEILDEFGLGTGADRRLTIIGVAVLLSGVFCASGLSFAIEALQGTGWSVARERVLFLARHDDLVGALAVCAAVWLWPDPSEFAPIYGRPLLAASLIIGFGLLLAFSYLLNFGRHGDLKLSAQPIFVAIIGLIVFTAGMSTSTHLPAAPTAFFFGASLGILGIGRRLLDAGLAATERPVRIALLVVVGAHLDYAPGPILLGVFIALARFGVKAILRAAIAGKEERLPFGAFVGAPSTALAFAASFCLSRPEPLVGNPILLTVAVAASVADLLALLVWTRRPPAEETEAEPEHDVRAEAEAAFTEPAP